MEGTSLLAAPFDGLYTVAFEVHRSGTLVTEVDWSYEHWLDIDTEVLPGFCAEFDVRTIWTHPFPMPDCRKDDSVGKDLSDYAQPSVLSVDVQPGFHTLMIWTVGPPASGTDVVYPEPVEVSYRITTP